MNAPRVLILCRHGRTLDHGCRSCLGPDDWQAITVPAVPRSIETRRPRIGRLLAVCALAIASALYLSAMASNASPHGPDAKRWETPVRPAPSSSTLAPPLWADNPMEVTP